MWSGHVVVERSYLMMPPGDCCFAPVFKISMLEYGHTKEFGYKTWIYFWLNNLDKWSVNLNIMCPNNKTIHLRYQSTEDHY